MKEAAHKTREQLAVLLEPASWLGRDRLALRHLYLGESKLGQGLTM